MTIRHNIDANVRILPENSVKFAKILGYGRFDSRRLHHWIKQLGPPSASDGVFVFYQTTKQPRTESASGTDAGVLRDFGEQSALPQSRVALASATLPDSSDQESPNGTFALSPPLDKN